LLKNGFLKIGLSHNLGSYMEQEKISFSFGRNWKNFAQGVTAIECADAMQDIEQWLGVGFARGKRVVDAGSGSGLHSLSFFRLGAESILSFDYDQESVNTTCMLWEKEGRPSIWTVQHGSVLDDAYIDGLGTFDIVYSWGVLHHTGHMWKAIENACRLVKNGGVFFVTLYAKGPRYEADLVLKRKYNQATPFGKRLMEYRWIANMMWARLWRLQNPLGWNEKYERGMNAYHDLVDWLGGLPYEVASEDEVVVFCRKQGLVLERIQTKCEGACSIYVFRHLA
jgi:SAM-dependent methyltransferase